MGKKRRCMNRPPAKPMPLSLSDGILNNKLYGVREYTPIDRNPNSPELHVGLEDHLSYKEERSKNKPHCAGKGKAPMLDPEDDQGEEEEDEDDEEDDKEEEEDEEDEDEEEEDEGQDINEEDDGLSDLAEDSDEDGTDIDTMENRTLKRLKTKTKKTVHRSGAKRRKNK